MASRFQKLIKTKSERNVHVRNYKNANFISRSHLALRHRYKYRRVSSRIYTRKLVQSRYGETEHFFFIIIIFFLDSRFLYWKRMFWNRKQSREQNRRWSFRREVSRSRHVSPFSIRVAGERNRDPRLSQDSPAYREVPRR